MLQPEHRLGERVYLTDGWRPVSHCGGAVGCLLETKYCGAARHISRYVCGGNVVFTSEGKVSRGSKG